MPGLNWLMHTLERKRSSVIIEVSLVLAVLVGILDHVTGMEVSISLFYLVPIAIAAWYTGRWAGLGFSFLCAVEGFLAGIRGLSSYSYVVIAYWNAVMEFGFYLTIALILVALKESLEREPKLARAIQRNLLPKELPVAAGIDISTAWEPSRFVGGDFFDIIQRDERSIAFLIADVTGHGTPAALLMSNLQAVTRVLTQQISAPGELCSQLNRQVVSSFPEGTFLTFFYALLDIQSWTLTYSNAGHNPPILVHPDGSVGELSAGGVAPGVVPQWTYEQGSVMVHAGDRLIMYTDGVTEAVNSTKQMFGEERLTELLVRGRNLGAKELRDSVLAAVRDFSEGVYEDDLALVCVAIESPAPPWDMPAGRSQFHVKDEISSVGRTGGQ